MKILSNPFRLSKQFLKWKFLMVVLQQSQCMYYHMPSGKSDQSVIDQLGR